jgi:hypothetical protein
MAVAVRRVAQRAGRRGGSGIQAAGRGQKVERPAAREVDSAVQEHNRLNDRLRRSKRI